MPRNIESLDDEPLPDGTPNFAGGLTTFPVRNTLAPNQFFIGQNCSLNKNGVVQTRRGTSSLGTQTGGLGTLLGMGYLDTVAAKKLLVAYVGGSATLRAFDGTNWAAVAGYVPVGGNSVQMVQGNDKLYLTDTTQNMRSWDGTTMTDLGGGATDAPHAKFIVWGTNRLIAAGVTNATDTVYFSDILDPSSTHWSAANRIRVGAGDGEPITGMAMWTETILVVFKRTRIWVVDITPSVSVSNFTINIVPTAYGCVFHRTITTVGRDLWFLSNDGVRSLSRTLQGDENEVSQPISLPIKNYTNLITDTWLELTCAIYFQGRYLLFHWSDFPAPDGSGTGYYTLAYNVELAQWEGRWDGWNTLCCAITKFNGQLRLVMGGNGGRVFYWRHITGTPMVTADYQDDAVADATAIPTRVGSRNHNFTAGQNSKRGFALEIEFDNNTAPTADVKLVIDDAAPVLFGTVVPAGRVQLTLLHQAPFRDLAVEVSSASAKLAVRSMALAAFLQTMPIGQ